MTARRYQMLLAEDENGRRFILPRAIASGSWVRVSEYERMVSLKNDALDGYRDAADRRIAVETELEEVKRQLAACREAVALLLNKAERNGK